MSVAAYPEYKDSDVEWLGVVPAHWEVCALKRIVSLRSGEAITSEDINEAGDFPVFGGNGHRGFTSGYTHDGHLALIGRQGALCGNVNYGSGRFWASEHAIVATPTTGLATIWLGELLRAMNLNQYSVAAAQPGLSAEAIGNLRIPFPSLPEQTGIASFLDRETGKIDALVEEQRRLIALLKEKRQAVISHAVTNGLDPNVPMKHSGVEWLGEVPAHWELIRLRFVAKLNPSKSEIANLDRETELTFLPMDAVGEEGALRLDELRPIHAVETGYTFFSEGDVGFAKITPCFENGKGAIMRGLVGGFGFGTTELTILRPIEGAIEVDFLNWILRSSQFRGLGEGDMYGAGGQKRVPDDFVRQYRAAIPPLSEQTEVNRFLVTETAKFDELLTAAEAATNFLQERRAALISAAVTGKIDVRNLVTATTAQEAA